jgi:tripartite ATP-independent transporter DctP family solute receptor
MIVKMSRRTFVGSATAAGLVGVDCGIRHAFAQEAWPRLRFANDVAYDHPFSVHIRAANKRILNESGGVTDIRMFTDSRLGNDQIMLKDVRNGFIQLLALSPLALVQQVPVAAISAVGYAFPDYKAVWSAMDGALGALVRTAIEGLGLHVFEKMWDNGYHQMTSGSHAITEPGDLKGFKLRAPGHPMVGSIFKALGADPIAIDAGEVYGALADNKIDGEDGPLFDLASATLYEVQKYCSLTAHMWDGFWLVTNIASWKKTAPKTQEIITRNYNMAAVAYREDLAALNATSTEQLTAKGMVFNKTDPKPFREALVKAGYYSDLKKKFDAKAWATLEKYSGPLR